MEIKLYQDKDLPEVARWFRLRNLEVPQDDLPEFGLSAFKDGCMVAIGFLRLVEGNMAILESFATNPECTSSHRSQAIDMIINDLQAWASSRGIRYLLTSTTHGSLVERVMDHGFNKSNQTFLVKSLGV